MAVSTDTFTGELSVTSTRRSLPDGATETFSTVAGPAAFSAAAQDRKSVIATTCLCTNVISSYHSRGLQRPPCASVFGVCYWARAWPIHDVYPPPCPF